MSPNFDDDNWQTGIGGFGIGDNDDRNIVDTVTALYLRTEFEIIDTSAIVYGVIHADYDDAFIAYLNGVEVARSNIGIVGDTPGFDKLPDYFHEATMYRGGRPEYFEINKELYNNTITEGVNVLAVQVQNDGIESSDLSAIFFHSVGIQDDSQNYMETPAWFQPPVFLTTSNLPIVQILSLIHI